MADSARTSTPVGRLVSVNVGLPRDVAWQGRTVRTAVWKEAVAGPRRVRRLNVDGDGQGDLAGHGGEHRAVFAYQLDSYRHWERELARDDFVYGQFGENFTVEGLPDDEVCVGDRFRVGTALLEVSQPRVTCYRVGIRMADPRVPGLLVSHRRPGFYLRVLEEGDVAAGDEIVKIASGPERMTVAEVDGLLYLPGHSPPDLRRALRIPALSPGWQGSFRALLEETGTGNAGLVPTSPPPAWQGFRTFTVAEIERESESVVSVRLVDAEGRAPARAQPGQYLTLRLRPDGSRPRLRSYSLCGPADDSYRIAVKRERPGSVSSFVHDRLRVGDEIEVAAPRGTFTLRQSEAPVLLVSAGVGVTPVLGMLHALAAERSNRPVWWLHGARSGHDHAFAAETRELLRALPDARGVVCFSRPGAGDVERRDFDVRGRISASLLASLDVPREADAYLCGPTAFMDELASALTALGIDPSRIHTERFGAAPALTPGLAPAADRKPHPPAGTPGTGPTIEFARSDLAVRWGSAYASVLELAEACDVPVRWSCRTGVCHTCETAIVSGAVDYDPAPVEDAAEGSALICCARPAGDLVLDL